VSAQFTTLVDRARAFWRGVTRDLARETELPEQIAQTRLVLGDLWADLGVRAFEVGVPNNCGSALPRYKT